MIKLGVARRLTAIIANVSLLFNSFVPFLLAAQPIYAQEAPAVEEVIVEPSPTPEPPIVEISPEPTVEPTPEITPIIEITPTPEILPEITPIIEITPTPEIIYSEPVESTPPPTDAPINSEVGTLTPPVETITPTLEPTTTPATEINQNNSEPSPMETARAPPKEISPTPTDVPVLGNTVSIDTINSTSTGGLIETTITETDMSRTDLLNPNIFTDKADYSPTDIAIITGSNFTPNTEYILVITSTDLIQIYKISSDENGEFTYSYQLDGTYRPDYQIEVKDATGSVVTSTTFTDSDWPLCGFQCTAGDVDVTKLELVDLSNNPISTCNPGDIVNVKIRGTFYNNSNAERVAVVLLGDVYQGTNLIQHLETQVGSNFIDGECVADTIPKNAYTTQDIHSFSWTCGDVVTIQNLVLSWDTNGTCNQFFSSPACSNRTTKCYSSTSFVVNSPLVANFSANDVCLGNPTIFTDSTTGGTPAYQYNWVLGDGTTSITTNPNHTYLLADSYDVNLTVKDSGTPQQTRTITKSVNVWPKPTVDFTASTQSCPSNSITFTNNSSLGTYLWNFGDGQTSTESNPTHSYANPGNYTVTLTTTGSDHGCIDQQTKVVTINPCKANLTIIKHVVSNNGGNKIASNFTINVTGTNVSDSSFSGSESPGTTVTLDGGTYSVIEVEQSGYSASYSADCSGTIAAGESKTCTITNDDISPQLTVIKHVDNNGNDGTLIASNFTIDVNGINVSDASFPGSESGTLISLDAGSFDVSETDNSGAYTQSLSGDCSGTIALDDKKTCTITNTGIDFKPAIEVTKTANLSSINEPGGDVIYTFTVKNLSTVEPVTITSLYDNKFGTLTGDSDCQVGTVLTVGQTCTFTYTGTISSDANTLHTNIFTADAVDNEGNNASDSASTTVTFKDVLPTIEITKSVDNLTLPEPGGVFTFTLNISNTSVETVTLTTLTDDYPLSPECLSLINTSLNAGESKSCTYTVVKTNAGVYNNTANVTVSDNENNTASDNDSETISITNVAPDISITKDSDDTSIPETGQDISFTFVVTNEGFEDVTLTSLNDSKFGDLNGQGDCATGGLILVGASYSCTITKFLSSDSLTDHYNLVTAVATDDDGSTDTATDDETVKFEDIAPTIKITKTPDKTSVPETGNWVTFTYKIENIGQEDVTLNSLQDSVFGDLNDHDAGDCYLPRFIPIGGSYSCTLQWFLYNDDLVDHYNLVTATATDDDGTTATDTDDATVTFTNVIPSIIVSKIANPTSVPETGGNIIFSYFVYNSSLETVTLTSLTDSVFGDLNGQDTCLTGGLISSKGTYFCTITKFLKSDSLVPYTNIVTAIVTDNDDSTATDTDDATVDFNNVVPTITLNKSVDDNEKAEPGGDFNYTLNITNNSFEDVVITSITDDNALSQACLDLIGDTLIPGQTVSCSYSITHTEVGTYPNTANVTVRDNEGSTASDDDSESVIITDVLPDISVTKTANPTSIPEPGGNATFTVVVTNNSVESVTLNSLIDDVYGDLNNSGTCSVPQTIVVGQTYSCTFDGSVGPTPGSYTDIVTAKTTDDDKNEDIASDNATVDVTYVPTLKLVKSVINDNGGSAVAGDWTLNAAGNSKSFSDNGATGDFHIVDPDVFYTLSESTIAGYSSKGWICDGGNLEGNTISLAAEDDVTCTITNDDTYGKVIVTKFNDLNGNGKYDEGENVLSGWDINLSKTTKTTGENGQVLFNQLLPGNYYLSETMQTGWTQTGIDCEGQEEPTREESTTFLENTLLSRLFGVQAVNAVADDGSGYLVPVNAGDKVYCYIGNKLISPKATIAKSNNALGDLSPGASVEYKIKLNIHDNDVTGFKVTDLLSNGFKYRAGSYKVTKNGVDYPITEPVYHSPGIWDLGELQAGDELELTYIADISTDQHAGKYADLAWASGDAKYEDKLVLALGEDSTYVNGNFVGTQVPVVKNYQNTTSAGVEKIENIEGEVLGATTELPGTGAATLWLIISGLLGIAGFSFLKISKKTMMTILLTILSFGLLISPIKAAENLVIRLEEPKSPINTRDIDLKFVALDISNRLITVKCFKKGPTDSDFSQFNSDIILTDGGNSSSCVLSSVINNNGSYQFKVTALAGVDSSESQIVNLDYKTSSPDTPSYYSKEEINNCDYKIKFKTADDGGKTVKIEVYRSDKTSFDLNSDTLIAGINIGSNQEYDIINSVPDCNKDYYFVIRAFDDAGNGSNTVGDSVVITNITNPTTTTTTTTGSVSGAIPLIGDDNISQEGTEADQENISDENQEGSILGSETPTNPKSITTQFQSFISRHKFSSTLVALLVLVIIGYVVKKIGKKKR